MRRIFTIVLLAVMPIGLLAQSTKVTYRIVDKEATYEPVGKEIFYPGDSITVQNISQFDLKRYTRGSRVIIDSQRIEYMSGTFEISELYALAERLKSQNRSKAIGGKDYTPGAFARPAGDKSINESAAVAVVSFLKNILNQSDTQTQDNSLIVSKEDDLINVLNKSEEDLFIDVLWVKNGRFFSAVSYAKDYVSFYPLEPNTTRTIKIDRFANAGTLYVIGTSSPVAYNTIDLNDYQSSLQQGESSDLVIHVVCVK